MKYTVYYDQANPARTAQLVAPDPGTPFRVLVSMFVIAGIAVLFYAGFLLVTKVIMKKNR
jgi:hypothetical protein